MSKVVKIKPKPTVSSMRRRRADSWMNPASGFGGDTDPIERTGFYESARLTQQQLDSMYEGDWATGRAVDIPAEDATREGITITHDTDIKKAELITEELTRLNVMEVIKEAITLDRLYGGNALILGVMDGKEQNEELGHIRRVDFLANVDRYHAYPLRFYQDPSSQRFGDPEIYTIHRLSTIGSLTKEVHESRIIRFDGAYLPPRRRIRNFGWGASIVKRMQGALKRFGVAMQSGANTLQDFITLAMEIGNLPELLSSETGEADLMERMRIMAAERAMQNIAIHGPDEKVTKLGTPTSGLPELIEIYMDEVSAAVEIPKSRFFHNQSGRLGGDAGENDLRIHYDKVKSYQENVLRSRLQRLIDVIAEPHGIGPGEIKFVFNPLWQVSDKEHAEVYNSVSQADERYQRMGVLEPEEIAINRFGGEGVNLTQMTINTTRREAMLRAMEAQPIDLDETEDPETEEPTEEQEDKDAPTPG